MTNVQQDLEAFSAWCAEQVRADGLSSVSVAVGVDNEIVFAEAYGDADVEAGRAATTETPYLLASITKPTCATAVCLLADRGVIDLDEPAETYLDGLRFTRRGGVTGSPTVRNLLEHTAGLWTQYEFVYVDTDGERRPFADSFSRYGVVFWEPGTHFNYANFGYGILDEVIRNASGREPEAFIREDVFLPLGMESAYIGPSYPGGQEAAVRYGNNGLRYPDYDMCHRGASAAWMTASDLVRFGFTRTGGPNVLSPEMSSAMVDGAREAFPRSHYGLGWGVSMEGAHRIVSHSGGMPGVSTSLSTAPDAGVVAVVLCNQSSSSLQGTVRNRLLGDLLPGYEAPPSYGEPQTVPTSVQPGRWVGAVATADGDVPVALTVEGPESVTISLAGGAPAEVTLERSALHDRLDPALVGKATVQLPDPDAEVRSPTVELVLHERDGGLSGVVAAQPAPEGNDRDGRLGNCYGYWAELARA
jgi:CubicO group peptidase (beta-lactamase class C family)